MTTSPSSSPSSTTNTSPPHWDELDRRAVDTARVLAMDAVEAVGNGHPGTAMAVAPVAYLLYQRFMRHDPNDPAWAGRDRFVLSMGHSSLTQYIQLYLAGYGLELDDLKRFRTFGSRTPGHPEVHHTPGIETTTGPLGQGLATAVGMAMASRYERGLFDPDTPAGESPFDHRIFVLASDGDMEEGVSHETASLAGTQALGNLVVVYDDNQISIEGDTDVAFTEDVAERFRAYGWHVLDVRMREDGQVDTRGMHDALTAAVAETERPSLIRMQSVIAWPAPHARNTGKAHGAALGAEEVAATKQLLGFDPDQSFQVAEEVLRHTRQARERGRHCHAEWDTRFAEWRAANPRRAALFDRLSRRELPAGWADDLPTFPAGKPVATRKASGAVIQKLAAALPELWGGSADLAESNNTTIEGAASFLPASSPVKDADPYGRVLHFGVREHAMGAALNGITLHGGTRVFGGTFLVFSDYMRPAVRLAALMRTPSIFVWTHDSIGLGEDGPTHQPVEHLWALRAIPGLDVVRPADANEVTWAWRSILEHTDRPAGLVLTRQNLPTLDRETYASAEGVARGAYVLAEADGGAPVVILIATGSEVSLALDARERLQAEGTPTRVVSAPCLEWFDSQDQAYRDSVLPPSVTARVSVEAGVAQGWCRYVGAAGRSVSLEHFGASAQYTELYEKFGITADAVVSAAHESLAGAG